MTPSPLQADFPGKLRFLFQPARYKVAHGGRGSAKSWGFARALLILASQKKLRVLCTREVQKSIKDSVHKLLGDQIQALGFGAIYQVLETEIRGANGSEFLFAGLSTQTVESIKSYEGVDVVWVEEAQAVKKRSWDVLTPTIRKPGSEIWITYNPELDSDETHQRFAVKPPPGAVVVEMNWRDNPWFPAELEAERLATLERDPEGYKNIWEGQPRSAVEGAIYHGEITAAIAARRIRPVPYDPLLKVHTVWDLGWNDSMSILCVQRHMSEVRVVDFLEDSHRTLDSYIAELRERRWNWGSDWLPHDGRAKNIQTGKSAEEVLRKMGRSVQIVANMDVESGIKAARMMFGRCYFDEDRCGPLVEHLKRYRRAISQTTNEPGAPLHDEHSHAADAFRYLGVSVDQMKNDERSKPIKYPPLGVV